MTRYAVGDVQGCLKPLRCLLKSVNFNPQKDQLWAVGDLINRGPQSLKTLRFFYRLGDAAKVVLGNHDLHLLAVAHGATKARPGDTLDKILNAPDRDELLNWLRQQPLLYSDPSGDYSMVHAGIPPQWDLQQARDRAAEVESLLRSNRAGDFFRNMYGNYPDRWGEQLSGWSRYRLITNYFTRMRFCTASGKLDLLNKSNTPSSNKFAPWFSHPRATAGDKIIFGHWASLMGKSNQKNVFAIDTGCVWGNQMTLMDIDREKLHQCQCKTKS